MVAPRCDDRVSWLSVDPVSPLLPRVEIAVIDNSGIRTLNNGVWWQRDRHPLMMNSPIRPFRMPRVFELTCGRNDGLSRNGGGRNGGC